MNPPPPVPESLFLSSVLSSSSSSEDYEEDAVERPSPLEFPCKVTSISVEGNKRIRTDLIMQEVLPALKATTHEQLASELCAVQDRLADLDAFRDTVCNVDVGDKNDEVTIAVAVQEEARHSLAYGALVADGELSFQSAWAYRDDEFNNAQQLRGAVSMGHRSSSGMLLEMIYPFATKGHHLRAHLFNATKRFATPSPAAEERRGFSLRVEEARGPNAFTYNLQSRSLSNYGTEEPLSVKSSFAHSYALLHSTPNASYQVLNTWELGGLPLGGYSFWKNHTEAQASYSKGPLAMAAFASLGLLQVGGGKKSHVCDRFFLGGPLNFRGFRYQI